MTPYERTNEALRDWVQGDCALGEDFWFICQINAKSPITNNSLQATEQDGEFIEERVRGFMVVSQTCDIARACEKRPFLEISVVTEVGPEALKGIKKGERPRFAFIPALEERGLVADLDRVMTVEKSLVLDWNRLRGFETDKDIGNLSRALKRKRGRFAFPDDFNRMAEALRAGVISKRHKKPGNAEGAAFRSLEQIRVHAAPSWAEKYSIDITVYFILSEDRELDANAMFGWVEKWGKKITPQGRFNAVFSELTTMEDLAAKLYVESNQLDLDHLSSS